MSDKEFLQICGAVSGAITDIYSKRANEHAQRYYAAIRNRIDDIPKIAVNIGYDIADIMAVKNYIFMEIHDFGEGLIGYFDPNFSMAQSWQRLIEGKNIQPHDITLIKHEMMELKLVKQGYTQDEAHDITSRQYNYRKESDEFYAEIKKYQDGKQHN